MAHTIPFDTYAYVKKLASVGVPEAQAEVQAQAIADLVNEQLATKCDLAELELRLKHDLTLRLGGIVVAGVTLLAALIGIVIALIAL